MHSGSLHCEQDMPQNSHISRLQLTQSTAGMTDDFRQELHERSTSFGTWKPANWSMVRNIWIANWNWVYLPVGQSMVAQFRRPPSVSFACEPVCPLQPCECRRCCCCCYCCCCVDWHSWKGVEWFCLPMKMKYTKIELFSRTQQPKLCSVDQHVFTVTLATHHGFVSFCWRRASPSHVD